MFREPVISVSKEELHLTYHKIILCLNVHPIVNNYTVRQSVITRCFQLCSWRLLHSITRQKNNTLSITPVATQNMENFQYKPSCIMYQLL